MTDLQDRMGYGNLALVLSTSAEQSFIIKNGKFSWIYGTLCWKHLTIGRMGAVSVFSSMRVQILD